MERWVHLQLARGRFSRTVYAYQFSFCKVKTATKHDRPADLRTFHYNYGAAIKVSAGALLNGRSAPLRSGPSIEPIDGRSIPIPNWLRL